MTWVSTVVTFVLVGEKSKQRAREIGPWRR